MTKRPPRSDDRSGFRFAGMLALGVLVVGALAGPNWCAPPSALLGRPAPGIEATIVAGLGADARDRVSLESLRGRVVLLDFWASWCPPCRASIPVLNRALAREPGVVAIGINTEAELRAANVARAHTSFHSEFPSIHDADFRLQTEYGIQSLPTLVLIDREGIVREVHTGVPDEDWLTERLAALSGSGRAP